MTTSPHDERVAEARALLLRAAESVTPLPTKRKLRRLDVVHMARTEAPPVPWVIDNFAARGALTMLVGEPGSGKSLIMLALASGVAGGTAVAGVPCRKGKAVVVDAENGATEIHRRIRAFNVSPDVSIFDGEHFDLERDIGELEGFIAHEKPALLVLDSMRSLWPDGEENDSSAMTKLLKPLAEIVKGSDVACVLLHHRSKGAADYRGSTAIGATIHIGIGFGRLQGDRFRSRRFITCFKCRVGPEPRARWLHVHENGAIERADRPEPGDIER